MKQAQTGTGEPNRPPQNKEADIFNIVVEVNGKNKHVVFETNHVTGKQIRDKVGATAADDLTRLHGNKPVGGNIGPDQEVLIHDGDHFALVAAGTVS